MKPNFSEKDSRGSIYIDCTECKRGFNGEKSCSAGAKNKKGNVGGCFSGNLLEKYDQSKL
jgi:hypothetical protein